MSGFVSIGDFSRMTHLTVKALRHYHEVGLLEPGRVDPTTGYRYYDRRQLTSAQTIRRLRELGMSLSDVKAVLAAPDDTTRERVLVEHLTRMENDLVRTQAAVASLRMLIENPAPRVDVTYRSAPATIAFAVRGSVRREDVGTWCASAFGALLTSAADSGARSTGPISALFTDDLFTLGAGDVTVFLPLAAAVAPPANIDMITVDEAELAIAIHEGPYEDLDRTYAALGAQVADLRLGSDGPIREHYLVTRDRVSDPSHLRTEVGWPISHKARNQSS